MRGQWLTRLSFFPLGLVTAVIALGGLHALKQSVPVALVASKVQDQVQSHVDAKVEPLAQQVTQNDHALDTQGRKVTAQAKELNDLRTTVAWQATQIMALQQQLKTQNARIQQSTHTRKRFIQAIARGEARQQVRHGPRVEFLVTRELGPIIAR